ncbi:hypothetical protein J2Z60_001065 [Lactobacillus colini]|uniref:DUF2184 domain-containing protein n=1 Tax=Lactobacillus colini TaxID=1819254 RepID=A0ABS4MDY1_9LACO|nr:encapsulin [Lactobacillus colini]MBP2057890.1 hypothetical protein [Lactobacillus colini]
MPYNMSLISKRDLIALDTHIYQQAKIQLAGRSLFKSFPVPRTASSYGYDVIKTTGKARRASETGRNTDTPVGDETRVRQYMPMTEWEYGIEYTDIELEEANAAGDTQFLTRRGNQAMRAMAEYEDKVIFNGVKDDNINGITSSKDKTGFQELKPEKILEEMSGEQMLNYFKKASHLITDLGYSNDKPVLLVTAGIETLLDTFYNEYRDNSVEDYVKKYFKEVRVIKELEAKYTGRKQDMALAYLDDADTAGIPTAIPLERVYQEHFKARTEIKYHEKFGGVVVRYPKHFVQMPGLTKA